LLFWLLEWK